MPAVTSVHCQRALQAAIKGLGKVPELAANTSALAIGAMNWAAWERKVQDTRRLEIWRMKAADKVPGSRRMILDTNPPKPRACDYASEYTFKYGGSRMHRVTATQVQVQQYAYIKTMTNVMAKMQENINDMLSHQIDAMAYGTMMHGNHGKRSKGQWYIEGWNGWWQRNQIEQPEYYERASRWQSNLTVSDPSLSDTSSPEHRCSPWGRNRNKPGPPSRTPRKSTGWLPTPGTKQTRNQRRRALRA